MKILVNASTLVVGGGVQIGVSFIEEAIKRPNNQYLFLVSNGIFDNLSEEIKNRYSVVCFNISPSGLINGRVVRKTIRKLEKQFNPDLVYSIGFPSYIFFKKPEVGRYTNPWEINREPLPWHTISGRKNKIRIKLGIWYRILWARRANYIETQTDAAKEGIATRVRFPKNRIKVIPNSPNSLFIEAGQQLKESNFFEKKDSIVFCLSAGYRHKNLDIIPDVAQEIVKRIGNCPLFILTLPNDSIVWNIIKEKATDTGTLSYIQNIGPIKLKTCIEYYQKARIVFLPTLLEVFSATYVEAMAMKVPIVTTDLDFAHDNCKQAAVYFEKENPVDAADKILALMTDSSLYNQKIREGLEVLNEYPTITEKYDQLFDWFQTIISGNEK